MIPADASTATEARHSEPYSGLVDHLFAIGNAGYEGRHIARGRHADGDYSYLAEEAAHVVWCAQSYPLVPWPQHVGVAA